MTKKFLLSYKISSLDGLGLPEDCLKFTRKKWDFEKKNFGNQKKILLPYFLVNIINYVLF